jgi:retron-type reverse transcriptase
VQKSCPYQPNKASKANQPYKPNKDLNQGTSFRRISLLSPLAKTLEKVILPQLTANIPNNTSQHGFKSKHSTTTALHSINNTITTGFNKKKPPERTTAVALDMSKAFDTVNHHILLQKLLMTKTLNNVLKFIANYIKGRTAYTLYNNSQSRKRFIKTGVPRGGVLSPSSSTCTCQTYQHHHKESKLSPMQTT